MDRTARPDRVITIGRASLDPNRPDPMHRLGVNETMADNLTKAKKTGIYVTNGVPQRFKAGDVLPAGAKLREATDEPLVASPLEEEQAPIHAADAKRAKGAAPENRAKE